MFWRFDLHTPSSHINTLLVKEDVTLTELMDEEDVVLECKAQNRKLVEVLIRPQNMEDMVTFITEEPSQDMEEKMRYKYSNISCELLTSDVSQINDRLAEDEALLMKLYKFLHNESPLNPLLASFFSKVLSILFSRKSEQIVSFLRKKEEFVDLLIKHIGTSAIMDLLLRLLTCIEPLELRKDVLNWLNEEKIVQKLIDTIHPSQDEDRHSNASQSLCEIIRLSRDQMLQVQNSVQLDLLLSTLQKQENIERLLSNIFDLERNESAIISAVQILVTVLETRRPVFENHESCPDMDSTAFTVSNDVLEAIKSRLKNFQDLLLEPPKKRPMKTTFGILDPPVGSARINIIKLLSCLLQLSSRSINLKLIELDMPGTVLDMYFHYLWNNFLHTQVEICIALILASSTVEDDPGGSFNDDSTGSDLLVKHLFLNCHLIERILEAWEENAKEQTNGGRRRGYMGHLTRIANCILHSYEKGSHSVLIQQLMNEFPDDIQEHWENFCSGPLAEVNKKNTIDLVATQNITSSSDDDIELVETFFSRSSVQQAFSDYQMQQMTSNFVDQFGFNEEDFADQDAVNASFDKVSDIDFPLNNSESANIALFETYCKDRIQQFEDSDSDEEDIWDEKDEAFQSELQSQLRSAGTEGKEGSTVSEDEGKKDMCESRNMEETMEVDSIEAASWMGTVDELMETAHTLSTNSADNAAWSTRGCTSGKQNKWNNFTSELKNPLRSCSPIAMETCTEATESPEDKVIQSRVSEEPKDIFMGQPHCSTEMESCSYTGENETNTDQITEVMVNCNMKETVPLCVDSKTEPVVFKSDKQASSEHMAFEVSDTGDISSMVQSAEKYEEGERVAQQAAPLPGATANASG
ncbi:serine/threonine-protein phosphatase 6 regulatory subunit 3 [Protopterus annectens]|uniref:serine/threonine-protein phosphatase 6 regulatory subunit 3 n=1 Tax=Protopterus annectens TaxID=7888 RepID=UPI001CF9BCA2|nr:serine/threonine-protein phosphatase 6 regulatory subunit 3 [Protopterus annectens]